MCVICLYLVVFKYVRVHAHAGIARADFIFKQIAHAMTSYDAEVDSIVM